MGFSSFKSYGSRVAIYNSLKTLATPIPITEWKPTTVPDATSNTFYSAVGMSLDGRYMACCQYTKGVYVSSDFGLTWIFFSINDTMYYLSVSSTGKYIFASSFSTTYLSLNFGVSFSTYPRSVRNIKISSDESLSVYVNTSKLYISNNDGSADIIPTYFNSISVRGMSSISSNGVIVVVSSNTIYISRDYGANWIISLNSNSSFSPNSDIDVSEDGKYILIGGNGNNVYYRGVFEFEAYTWTTNTLPENFLYTSMSSSGQYQFARSPTQIYTSNNYGLSFSICPIILNTNNTIHRCIISFDGSEILYSTQCNVSGFTGGYVYGSIDNGNSFTLRTSINPAIKNFPYIALSKTGLYQLQCNNNSISTLYVKN